MSRITIQQLTDGLSIDQPFQVADKQLRVNRQGGKYLLLKLSDRSGTLSAMVWNVEDDLFETFHRGDFLQCDGRTQLHNGNLQIIISQFRVLDPSQVDLADFDRFDAQAAQQSTERLSELLSGFRNVHLRRLAQLHLDDRAFMAQLQIAPAAVSHHHAYPGGLLRHTVDMIELAQFIGPRYQGLDHELLMMGAFLHDLGKIAELRSGNDATYTDRGQLVGHLVIGVEMLNQRIAQYEAEHNEPFPTDLLLHLQHLILSHHGQMEFGSPRIPQTLEALALHHIDNLDAKMAAALSVIETDVSGNENWTNYHPGLGRKMWKPKS